MSVTLKSRTLNVGDSIAHWRPHPLQTASSRFRVVLSSRLKMSVMASLTAGTRQLPPNISTESISPSDSSGERNTMQQLTINTKEKGKC